MTLRSGTVVVVGSVNVDAVVETDRLPGPGETVVGPEVRWFGGGKGANAAVAAARAGAAVKMIGAVGRDDPGRGALDDLRADGVDVTGVAELDGTATGVALIVVDAAGENQIAVGAGANAAVSARQVRSTLAAALPGTGCVLVSTEIPGQAVTAAVDMATAAGVPCVLNPAPPIPAVASLLGRSPILTPNEHEAAALGGAASILERTRAPVVVTLGGDGVALHRPGAEPRTFPVPPTEVVDTTGAGDTFNGVLASRLAAGDTLDDAITTAVIAASLSVAAVGARSGMPTADAIEAASPG